MCVVFGFDAMELQKEIQRLLTIYQEEVLTRRTRAVPLFGRKCQPEITETFLGVELQLGKRRITFPDVSTARYARIFAELGMDSIHTPYDPSLTARILPELEESLNGIKIGTSSSTDGTLPSRQTIYRQIRQKIKSVERQWGGGGMADTVVL